MSEFLVERQRTVGEIADDLRMLAHATEVDTVHYQGAFTQLVLEVSHANTLVNSALLEAIDHNPAGVFRGVFHQMERRFPEQAYVVEDHYGNVRAYQMFRVEPSYGVFMSDGEQNERLLIWHDGRLIQRVLSGESDGSVPPVNHEVAMWFMDAMQAALGLPSKNLASRALKATSM